VPSLLIATTNPGKVREIRRVLEGLPWLILTLGEVRGIRNPVEDGRTFAENARIKAAHYAKTSGLPTVAEDSGLAIDALHGRPGVESARYPGATYADKFVNLYRELASHPRPWTARFVCSLAFVTPGSGIESAPGGSGRSREPRLAFTGEASVEGEIAPEPRGTRGFGYDPIFLYPPYGRTLAEVSDDEKLRVAHRGKAFRQFREWLLHAALTD
jgi:XTP/dITP diphosphohydrolase